MTIDSESVQRVLSMAGNGDKEKSILLLHGLGVYGVSWAYQVEALSKAGYASLSPDLPGFGKSPAIGSWWSVEAAGAEMIRLLDREKFERTVLCGLSMGGAVALHMALTYPERVNGLVLINTFAALRPASISEVVYFLKRGLWSFIVSPSSQAKLVAERIFPKPEQDQWREFLIESIQVSDPRMYRQAMIALGRFNVSRQLAELHLPVMVITGKNDTTIPPVVQRKMAEQIPEAERYEIEDAGHGVIVDHYDEVNQLLLKFMAQVYPS
ncbi:MAG TPA: alpha/beta hydrolase [Bellilinea sp.]|nr:alpha/beta hydrolase [Bellilinea sp.]